MVTASHNPPEDNGYKVYLGDGAQLVPPADRLIEAAIAAVGPAREVQLERRVADPRARGRGRLRGRGRGRAGARPGPPAATLVVAYTAMHGVGAETTHGGVRRRRAAPAG